MKLKSDLWARIVRDEDLSEKEKELRDRAWQIISFIVTQEPSIYYRDYRGALIQQTIEKYNAGRTEGELVAITVYKYLRRFWQRGKNKNALLPDYANSGGRGKPKASGEKKRGRPRKYAQFQEIGIGRNVTEEDKRIFRFAIAKFYNNSKKIFLTTAHDLIIKEYYSEDFYDDENKVKKSILILPNKRPTFTQFKYWYEVEQCDIRKTIISRKGSRKYALENRAITGTSQMETISPGSRYQIDATIADVYLVSLYNRNWIIGRPVIYVIIDVFSRMITGVYLGLGGPSWTGAMMALANAATEKVKFCQLMASFDSSTPKRLSFHEQASIASCPIQINQNLLDNLGIFQDYMVSFFPKPYPDEILYSVLACYHIIGGNTSPKITLQELFALQTTAATVDLPLNLNNLIQNLQFISNYQVEDLIFKQTLYPLYNPFLPANRSIQVLESMKGDSEEDIHTKAGIMASSIIMPKYFRFCPACKGRRLKELWRTLLASNPSNTRGFSLSISL